MPAASQRSLRSALATLLVPLLAGLAAAGGALVWEQWDARRGAADARLQEEVQRLALRVEREIAIDTAIIDALAQSPLIERGEWGAFHTLARRVNGERDGSVIALASLDGQILVNTAVPWGAPLANPPELEREGRQVDWKTAQLPVSSGGLSRRALDAGRPAYSNLYYGVAIKEPCLSVVVPVERGGHALYTITYALSASSLGALLASESRLSGALAQVIDSAGRIAASSRGHDELVARVGPVLMTVAGGGVGRIAEPGAGTRLAVVSPIGDTGWRVMSSASRQSVYADAYTGLATSLALLAIAMALVIIVVYRHSRRLSRPLHELARRVREDTPHGPAPVADIREIALLGVAIEQAALARERERDEQVRRRLAEERELHAHELALELQAADGRKNAFLATLAHELRNPLGPLLNALHLLQHAPPDGVSKLHGIMSRQVEQISGLVGDLLDVTRIAQGKIDLARQRVDLCELLRRLVDDHDMLLRDSSVELRAELPGQPLHAEVDARRVRQMVVNLLQNAIKFTPEDGVVTLSLSAHERMARIVVSDTGCGIEPEALDGLFEPFVQGKQQGARWNGGLGLGLAIVKGVATLHGGSVHASSVGAGRGARFLVELPLAA